MEIPRHWRLQRQRYSLVGEVCNNCEEKIFPPRDVCPHCGGEKDPQNGRVSSKKERVGTPVEMVT